MSGNSLVASDSQLWDMIDSCAERRRSIEL